MNLEDPRVIKTLQHIDEALLENLDKYEFRKITVDMLCRVAMINRSTFYKYYRDKFELLDSFLNRTLEEFSTATVTTGYILASPYTISSADYIKNFRRTINYIHDHRTVYMILWKATIGRRIYQEMEDIICRNILNTIQGDPPGTREITPYHDLYARIFASNLMTLVRWWLTNEPAITEKDVESVMEGNMKNGLFATFSDQNQGI